MVGTSLSGARDLVKKLRAAQTQAPQVTGEALRQWARDVRKAARDEAPVETGTLRKSLAYRVKKKQLTAEVGYWGRGLEDAYYVWWVHDGTERIKSNDFLNRAFLENDDLEPYLRPLVEKMLE